MGRHGDLETSKMFKTVGLKKSRRFFHQKNYFWGKFKNGMHYQERLILLFFVFMLFPYTLQSKDFSLNNAEVKVSNLSDEKDTTISNQKDIREVLVKALNLKMKPDSLNQKGYGPFVSVFPAVDYALQSGYLGLLSISTSFYSSPERNKILNVLFNANYSQYHQFWTIVNSNIFFDKLKLHLFGDWKYYNYPTHTFGLGSKSSFADKLNIDFSYVRFYKSLFREIVNNVYAGISITTGILLRILQQVKYIMRSIHCKTGTNQFLLDLL